MKTVFSGIQPSGELHLGNYLGAVRNWVELQQTYRCFFSVVDYHAITQSYERKDMRPRVFEMAADLLAAGLNPDKCVIFVQSAVPEHTELCWILNCVTPFGDLGRMTQFKDKSNRQADNINVGLFDYPVLQAADILLYMADAVPVGQDQVQHVELSRRIARAFNNRWGKVFPEPQPLLTRVPKLLGLDGQAKMSKSIGNTISLGATDKQIIKSLRRAATDPQREKRDDPGDPDKCNLYALHTFFSDDERRAWVREGCTTAGIGCVDCEDSLSANIIEHLAEYRERKKQLADDPDRVREVLAAGAERARQTASRTMEKVRHKLGLYR